MPRVRPRSVTLHDVAQRSDVSYQTVSRVINNHPHVSPETRRRVLQTIQELGYRPNRAARSLVTRQSCTLGIITFGTNYYGPSQMMANVERAAKARGYNLIFSSIDDVTPDVIRETVNNLSGKLVDGLVLITPVLGISHAELVALCAEIPFVEIDAELGATVPSVVIDQRYGSQLATQHLIDLGHRAICEIRGPVNWCGARARHEGWRATLEAARITPLASVEGDWTSASGHAAAHGLLDEGASFTALVVGNDQMALGAMHAMRERGLRVPEDVSVVGFDDIPEAAYFEPPLTAIRQDFAVLGEQTVQYLVALITDPDTPLHQFVQHPHLIERLSARRVR